MWNMKYSLCISIEGVRREKNSEMQIQTHSRHNYEVWSNIILRLQSCRERFSQHSASRRKRVFPHHDPAVRVDERASFKLKQKIDYNAL